MVVNYIMVTMLHLLFWLAQTTIIMSLKFSLLIAGLFMVGSINIMYLGMTTGPYVLTYLILWIMLYSLLPLWMSIPLLIIMFMLLIKNIPYNTRRAHFWSLAVKNLELLIIIRECLYMSDKLNKIMNMLLKSSTLFIVTLLFVLYASQSQASTLMMLLFSVVTFSLSGMSLSFLYSLFNLKSYTSPNLTLTPSQIPAASFANFLQQKANSHPLKAVAEESFYEDNLQMGDFFIVYPIFFKASAPKKFSISTELEILKIWHTIRWESAFSKQLGSGASRWSSIVTLSSTSIPDSIHSIHIPLIPVFNDDLFYELNSHGLLTLDPFAQPPEWSPYQALVSFLNWSDDDKKEERLNEMDEED